MARHTGSIRIALLAASMLAATPVLAADVTPERLLNPDKEPQNWLMNHRTYDGQRYSPLGAAAAADGPGDRDGRAP
jgi:glucose dehydrogenase